MNDFLKYGLLAIALFVGGAIFGNILRGRDGGEGVPFASPKGGPIPFNRNPVNIGSN